MRHIMFLIFIALMSSVIWSAEQGNAQEKAKAEQWYKAELALIDVTLTDENGDQTFLYLNSRGDATIRRNAQEKRGTIKVQKDKAAAAFVLYIYGLPSEKMPETKISAHIQRRIGKDTEHFIRYFATADDAKALRAHIEAVAQGIK